MAKLSEYEKFQHGIFDQIEQMEESERHQLLKQFVKLCRQHGIDVVSEIVGKGRTFEQVLAMVIERSKPQEPSR